MILHILLYTIIIFPFAFFMGLLDYYIFWSKKYIFKIMSEVYLSLYMTIFISIGYVLNGVTGVLISQCLAIFIMYIVCKNFWLGRDKNFIKENK